MKRLVILFTKVTPLLFLLLIFNIFAGPHLYGLYWREIINIGFTILFFTFGLLLVISKRRGL